MNMVSRVRTNVTDRIDKFTISEARVSAFRMHRHHLDLRAPSSRLPSVVGDVCGVQAQVTAMARIALWARLRQLTVDDIEQALVQKRTIVKTWSMRGARCISFHRTNFSCISAVSCRRGCRESRDGSKQPV